MIFDISFQEGIIPEDWRDAQVTPLYKKDEKANPSNYRSVSLTSIVCKVMEGFVRDKVTQHLSEHSLLTSCQQDDLVQQTCSQPLRIGQKC